MKPAHSVGVPRLAPSGPHASPTRRRLLGGLLGGGVLAGICPAAFAELLTRTPRQTEGPFYPVDLPLDTDNDLIIINDSLTPAVGEITHLSGRLMDEKGQAIAGALVEIWQVDHHGVYLHKGSGNIEKRDGNFQGFGRFLTGTSGEYYFRTVKPVPYPGRTPHIHFAVKIPGRPKWTTQCYVADNPENATDMVITSIKDPAARAAVMVPFVPLPDSKIGELTARFDIVMGLTPAG